MWVGNFFPHLHTKEKKEAVWMRDYIVRMSVSVASVVFRASVLRNFMVVYG